MGRPAVRDVPLPARRVLIAILRGERVITPSPDEPLEAGDELLFVTTRRRGAAEGGAGPEAADGR